MLATSPFVEGTFFVRESNLLHTLLIFGCLAELHKAASQLLNLHAKQKVHVLARVTKLGKVLLKFGFNGI